MGSIRSWLGVIERSRSLKKWHLPVGMKDLYLYSTEVTGAVYNLVLPEGMQNVNFNSCQGLKGSVDKLALLEGKCRTWTSAAAGASQAHFPPPKGQRSRTTAARKRTSKLCGNEVCIHEPTARCKKKSTRTRIVFYLS